MILVLWLLLPLKSSQDHLPSPVSSTPCSTIADVACPIANMAVPPHCRFRWWPCLLWAAIVRSSFSVLNQFLSLLSLGYAFQLMPTSWMQCVSDSVVRRKDFSSATDWLSNLSTSKLLMLPVVRRKTPFALGAKLSPKSTSCGVVRGVRLLCVDCCCCCLVLVRVRVLLRLCLWVVMLLLLLLFDIVLVVLLVCKFDVPLGWFKVSSVLCCCEFLSDAWLWFPVLFVLGLVCHGEADRASFTTVPQTPTRGRR